MGFVRTKFLALNTIIKGVYTVKMPKAFLVLPWNFKDEIVSLCRSAGYDGPFLIPFPNKLYFL